MHALPVRRGAGFGEDVRVSGEPGGGGTLGRKAEAPSFKGLKEKFFSVLRASCPPKKCPRCQPRAFSGPEFPTSTLLY